MGRLPASAASKQDYERAIEQAADAGLVSLDGALQHFPGAALVAGRNGIVLAANAAAEPIAGLLRQGASEELRAAIDAALHGRSAQVNPLLLPPGNDGRSLGPAFDVAILPWGDGTLALLLGRDVTLERSLRSALIESRQRYKDLVEAASDFAWETDAEGNFAFVSSRGALGYSAEQLVGTPAIDVLEDQGEGAESPFVTRAPVHEVEVWVHQADGEVACLLVTALPLFGAEGRWRGARGLCQNITSERRQRIRLAGDRHRERLLAYILGILREEMDPERMLQAAAGALTPALSADGACIYRRDKAGALVCAARAGQLPAHNELAPIVKGVASGEDRDGAAAPGRLLAVATACQGERNGVLCLWRAGAEPPWSSEDRSLLGEIAAQIGVTNRQLARQEELVQLSTSDPLTGLLNRRGFMAELERRHARRSAWRSGGALFFVDMDNFKAVNDRHGHQEGDRALVMLARILRQQTRSRDLVARLGGDEFALFIEGLSPDLAEQKGRDLLAAAGELKSLSGDPDRPLGLSIGIAFRAPGENGGLDALIERADRAMYAVKRRGKSGMELVADDGHGAEP